MNKMIYRTQYQHIHSVYFRQEKFIGTEYILRITILRTEIHPKLKNYHV